MSKAYSLRKSNKILHASFKLFKKNEKNLSRIDAASLEDALRKLELAIIAENRERASDLAKDVQELSSRYLKKSFWHGAVEIGTAVIFAFVIAVVVRQVWFEPYVIPSGSMRPSFKEEDHLLVTKTTFGINVPLLPKHIYFDPDNLRRGGVIIFSADNLNISDTDSSYFLVLPYKKRYIKRLIGKPGDTLYFYGGKIYGIDAAGQPIAELLQDPYMQKLEHIPFLSFEGDSSVSDNQYIFRHFGQMLGRVRLSYFTQPRGEIFYDNRWREENSELAYYDFFGMQNFARARLLTPEEVVKYTDFDPDTLGKADLYLELKHHPHLGKAEEGYGYFGELPAYRTIIPLQERHIEAIRNNIYTSRFSVSEGRVTKSEDGRSRYALYWPSVSNGTYEFYFGKAFKIGFKGWSSPLPPEHPIYDRSLLQELFNYGIELLPVKNRNYFPRRFAYFRNGDLYMLGAPIIKKDDPVLITFLQKEREKEGSGYRAFRDYGEPGKEVIMKFGLKVPSGHYLVLGDNHAVSADSRIFGFLPEDNIKGAPSLIIWPPGERWGRPPQTPYPLITLPRLIIWSLAVSILLTWYIIHRKRMRRRLF